MTSAWLLDIAIGLSIGAILLALLQWVGSSRNEQKEREKRVTVRMAAKLSEEDLYPQNKMSVGHRFQVLLDKADISLSLSSLLLFVVVVLFAGLVVVLLVNAVATVFVWLVVAFACWFVWWRRYQGRRKAIFEALPGVMDAVVRGMDAGMSLEQSLIHNLEEAPPIYAELAFRVRAAAESGRDYAESFDWFGEFYDIPSFVMVSIGLSTSRRFGASVRPILLQTAESLRSQDQMRREFMAATSETRFSAIVFAAMPVLLGAGLIAGIPTYRQVLLYTTSGHHMLMYSGGLVLLGGFWLYRMVQGVGRG